MGRKTTSRTLRMLGKVPLSERRMEGPPPECPPWLDEDARAEWARIVPQLVGSGLACGMDEALLASYCHAFSAWKQAVEVVQRDGMTWTDGKGNIKAHPAVRITNDKANEMRKLADMFGFSPASRDRLPSPPPDTVENNELQEFLCEPAQVGENKV